MRILLTEDELTLAQSIELMLRSESFEVITASLGEDGLSLARSQEYEIILLDLNLPDMSGYEVLRSLRTARVTTPVLILSGLDGIDSKVKGLGFGADDYLTKPFHNDELVARIHAIVRRSAEQAEAVVHCGDQVVRLGMKRAEIAGKPVTLTGKEYAMLELMALRKGSTLTKEMFLNAMYGGMDEPEMKISTCSSASCVRSWRRRRAGRSMSRPSGVAA